MTAHVNALLLHQPEEHTTTDASTGITHVDGSRDERSVYRTGTEMEGFRSDGGEVAICVGLDGWHYSRAALDGFEDPKEAHYRRVSAGLVFSAAQ